MRRRRTLFAGFVARMEGTRLPKCVMFGELVRGAGCVGRQEKEWKRGVFHGRYQSFQYQRRPVVGCSPGRGGMTQERRNKGRNVSGQNGSLQRKLEAGLRHAVVVVVRPNVAGRNKERITQSKRVRTGSLAIVD